MSKATFAIIAAVSAGTGAAVTAAIMRPDKKEAPAQTITTTTTTVQSGTRTSPAPPTTVPVPASQVFVPQPPTTAAQAAALTAPVNPAGLFEYGFPGPVSDLATRSALVSSYDRRLRNPHWVVEHITPASLAQREGDRKHSVFAEDTSVPEKFRAKLKDYFRSGYDRGHQVPAADCKWSQQAMDDTFYLSNMCPQVGDGFNRDYWAHFEDFCRRLTDRYPSVRVVTGPPLPAQARSGRRQVVHKVIFAEDGRVGGNVALGAFVLPNTVIPNNKPITDFEVPLEAVERASGLEFAEKLPAARRRRLCADYTCALVIKDYAERQKAFGKDPAKPVPLPQR
ncbi:hypothetical protein OPQ81_000097 [Rhizoctonia solani]|nr:hypothetical protein OPQ81_000097 [Rhizoctonia solani]